MANKALDVNPWLRIWVKPRETIRKIVKFNPKFRFILLSGIYGFPVLLQIAQSLSLGDDFSTIGILIGALVLCVFVGMLGITIASGLLLWTGHWIGGKATYHPVRAAVAWSNVPNVVSIIIWLILVGVFGSGVFMDEFVETPPMESHQFLLSGAMFIQSIISIWSFIILIKGLGEVNGFSAWKGLLNVLIPFFLIGIAIWLLSWVFWVGAGVPQG